MGRSWRRWDERADLNPHIEELGLDGMGGSLLSSLRTEENDLCGREGESRQVFEDVYLYLMASIFLVSRRWSLFQRKINIEWGFSLKSIIKKWNILSGEWIREEKVCAAETYRRQLCKSGAQKRRVGHKSRFWQHVGIRWRHYCECLNQKALSIFTLGILNLTDKVLKFIINIHCIICLYIFSLIQLKCVPWFPSKGILTNRALLLHLVQSKC